MESTFCWYNTVPADDAYPPEMIPASRKGMMCRLPANHTGRHWMELMPHSRETINAVLRRAHESN